MATITASTSETCEWLGRLVIERGQVSIPSAVRSYLNLQPGMGLLWNTGRDRYSCTITIVRKRKPKGARAMLGFASTFRAPRTTAEWMRELREGENQ